MENKRLLSDIYTICCGSMFDAIQLRLKYKDKFKQNEQFNAMLKDVAVKHFKNKS